MELTNSFYWTVWHPPTLQSRMWRSVWIFWDVWPEPKMTRWKAPDNLGGKFSGRSCSSLTIHHTKGNTSLDDLLGIPKSAFPIFLPTDVKDAEELDFDTTNIIALFKNKNYNVHMCFWIMSNILCPSVSVFNTRVRPNVSAYHPSQSNRARDFTPYVTYFRSASESPVKVIGKIILFFQLGDLQIRVHFGSVDNLTARFFVIILFTDRYEKKIFMMEHFIVPIQSHPVAGTLQHTAPSDLLVALQTDSHVNISMEDGQDKNDWTPLFQVAKCVTILPNTEAAISVTTRIARLIYMTPYWNSLGNWMVLRASGTVNGLPHVATTILLTNFRKPSNTAKG